MSGYYLTFRLLCITGLLSACCVYSKESYVTVEGQVGHCVPLGDCGWILTKATLQKDIISRSVCGDSLDYSTTYVCCPRWQNAKDCGRLPERNASREEHFPWVVSVRYHVRKRSFLQRCTGSLISRRFVLTAAHCILNIYRSYVPHSIRLKVKRSYKDYRILRSIIHPDYNKLSDNKENDIALFKLAEAVDFDEYVRPICLPMDDDYGNSLFEGEKLTIFAVGPETTGSRNQVKHPIALPLRNSSVCDKIYRDVQIQLVSSQLCVGGEVGKDSCPGDSGGPLMHQLAVDSASSSIVQQWYQVGIVSLGPPECGRKIPGIYTRLRDYIDWITANVNESD